MTLGELSLLVTCVCMHVLLVWIYFGVARKKVTYQDDDIKKVCIHLEEKTVLYSCLKFVLAEEMMIAEHHTS